MERTSGEIKRSNSVIDRNLWPWLTLTSRTRYGLWMPGSESGSTKTLLSHRSSRSSCLDDRTEPRSIAGEKHSSGPGLWISASVVALGPPISNMAGHPYASHYFTHYPYSYAYSPPKAVYASIPFLITLNSCCWSPIVFTFLLYCSNLNKPVADST